VDLIKIINKFLDTLTKICSKKS